MSLHRPRRQGHNALGYTSDVLESITRDSILRLCSEVLHIAVEEREVDRTELYIADEMFFCGTWWEVTPVGSGDRLPVGDGRMGPVTKAIATAFGNAVPGTDKRYEQWLAPVW